MLDALGGCVECPNDDIMNAMMIPACLMGPMYGIMRNNRDWLGETFIGWECCFSGGRGTQFYVGCQEFFSVIGHSADEPCFA